MQNPVTQGDDQLLDQLIAQQTSRQGHPLASIKPPPPTTNSLKLDPSMMGLLEAMLGPEAAHSTIGPAAAQQIKTGRLPSDVVGMFQGKRITDIDLPPAVQGLQQYTR